MKARILPTDEFAEYGKTDTVVLVMSVNKTEAHIILDWMEDVDSASWRDSKRPHVVELLSAYMQTIADANRREFDAVNTEGRSRLHGQRSEP